MPLPQITLVGDTAAWERLNPAYGNLLAEATHSVPPSSRPALRILDVCTVIHFIRLHDLKGLGVDRFPPGRRRQALEVLGRGACPGTLLSRDDLDPFELFRRVCFLRESVQLGNLVLEFLVHFSVTFERRLSLKRRRDDDDLVASTAST